MSCPHADTGDCPYCFSLKRERNAWRKKAEILNKHNIDLLNRNDYLKMQLEQAEAKLSSHAYDVLVPMEEHDRLVQCADDVGRMRAECDALKRNAAKAMKSGNVCDLHPLTATENGTVEGCAGCFGEADTTYEMAKLARVSAEKQAEEAKVSCAMLMEVVNEQVTLLEQFQVTAVYGRHLRKTLDSVPASVRRHIAEVEALRHLQEGAVCPLCHTQNGKLSDSGEPIDCKHYTHDALAKLDAIRTGKEG